MDNILAGAHVQDKVAGDKAKKQPDVERGTCEAPTRKPSVGSTSIR